MVVGSTVWPMDYHPPCRATWMQVAETWHPLVQRRRDFKGTGKAEGNLDFYCKTYGAPFDFGVKAFFRSNNKKDCHPYVFLYKNWNYATIFCRGFKFRRAEPMFSYFSCAALTCKKYAFIFHKQYLCLLYPSIIYESTPTTVDNQEEPLPNQPKRFKEVLNPENCWKKQTTWTPYETKL